MMIPELEMAFVRPLISIFCKRDPVIRCVGFTKHKRVGRRRSEGTAEEKNYEPNGEYESGGAPDHSVHAVFLIWGRGSADTDVSHTGQVRHIASPGHQVGIGEVAQLCMAAGAGHDSHQLDS